MQNLEASDKTSNFAKNNDNALVTLTYTTLVYNGPKCFANLWQSY